MINYFFVWICLLLMAVMGIIVYQTLPVRNRFASGKEILLLPGIGIIFTVNMVQILNLLFPVLWIAYLWLAILLFGGLFYRKTISRYFKVVFKNKRFLFIILGITFIWMLPFWGYGELVSFQVWNNDIIYYLSSMNWLKEHSSLQNVVYDTTHPFYWCAEYMLNRTRTGFDGFGALIMCIFGLQAHEVFSGLGVVFGITVILHVYYLLSEALQVSYKIKAAAIILITLSGRIGELLIYQYLPQILGISLLLLLFALAILVVKEKAKIPVGGIAFVLSGIISVYAEFCSYVAILLVGIFVFGIIRGKKELWNRGLLEGGLALILNPIGTYRAIKINLFVLFNVGGNMDNIDPFNGKTAAMEEVFAQISGISGKITILVWLFVGIMLVLWVYYAWKVPDENKFFCFYPLGFWTVYEIYFRIISYGYGEYKHLISGTVLFITINLYIAYSVIRYIGKKLLWEVLLGLSACFWLISGVIKTYSDFIQTELYYFDNQLMELEEAARFVDASEYIGISGTPATVHGAVYALKNNTIKILSNNISYFPYSEEASGRYQLMEGDYLKRGGKQNERYVWGNGRFYLVENLDLQLAYYTGFHLTEIENYIDTCDKESSVMLYNYASEEKYFSVAFDTEKIGLSGGNIKLVLNGEVVGEGKTGDYFVTDMLMLNPGEKMRLYLYYDGELSESDNKIKGFRLKDVKMITYEEEQVNN